MKAANNGGAYAIKGFNYQKSIIILVAVLNYLNRDDFQIYIEAEDDIVVMIKDEKTYIQAKGKELSLKEITNRPDGKDSILEKNLANGNEEKSFYKLIAPSFKNSDRQLLATKASIFTKGASVYAYTKDSVDEIKKKLPGLSDVKLGRSKIALTTFQAKQKEALLHIMGIMADEGIPVDNNWGKASLQELCNQIDERSEKIVNDPKDYELKKFTHNNLATIFRHSHRDVHFQNITSSLGYNLAKQIELKTRRVKVSALFSTNFSEAKKYIEELDLMTKSETEVVRQAIAGVDFENVTDEIDKEVIVIDAFSMVLYERSAA